MVLTEDQEVRRFVFEEQQVLISLASIEALPTPPFSQEDKQAVAKRVYDHIWQQSVSPEGHIAA